MTDPEIRDAVAWLRSPAAIRARCGAVLAAAEAGRLEHFALDAGRLDAAAGYVVDTIRVRYPDLAIPYHSRWRHLAAGGRDRWSELAAQLGDIDPDERARVRFDLVVPSVLLDAGAGSGWRFDEAGGGRLARSEGLAVASVHACTAGLFSADPDMPLRADGAALAALDAGGLAAAFQVRADNALVGLDGRVELMRRLGRAVLAQPEVFGAARPRVGNLFDHLKTRASGGRLPGAAVLEVLLGAFGDIWPGRLSLGGVNLGDVGRHPAAAAAGPTDRLVPFHKLSQWLAYSLVEPLEEAGIEVAELDTLTGLAEYRNGGLLIDLGVLRPKHDGVMAVAHRPDSEVVVEWRALTVALLDRLAERVRARLDLSAAALPLAKVLEGGTWSAGRRIASELRPDGAPPIRLVSDGTVF